MKRVSFLLVLLLAACNRGETAQTQSAAPKAAGDVDRGRQLASQYGCNVCHAMPGVEGPQGSLGPSLAGLASRTEISFGTVPNTPANLVQFIQQPASLNPQSSMPPVGLTPDDAQHITAYLLTLK